MKRLADVVIGTELEPADAILGAGVRGQEDDRGRRRALAQQPRQLEAVAVGQTHIEQRELENPARRCARRALATESARTTCEAGAAQPLGQRLGDVALVLDHQQLADCPRGRHGAALQRLSCAHSQQQLAAESPRRARCRSAHVPPMRCIRRRTRYRPDTGAARSRRRARTGGPRRPVPGADAAAVVLIVEQPPLAARAAVSRTSHRLDARVAHRVLDEVTQDHLQRPGIGLHRRQRGVDLRRRSSALAVAPASDASSARGSQLCSGIACSDSGPPPSMRASSSVLSICDSRRCESSSSRRASRRAARPRRSPRPAGGCWSAACAARA